jgi:hypothetical protein
MDQRGVAGVERAHGGDQGNQVSEFVGGFASERAGPVAEFGYGVEDFHQAFFSVSFF